MYEISSSQIMETVILRAPNPHFNFHSGDLTHPVNKMKGLFVLV